MNNEKYKAKPTNNNTQGGDIQPPNLEPQKLPEKKTLFIEAFIKLRRGVLEKLADIKKPDKDNKK